MLHDITVIGAGPAGIAAYSYLTRAGFEPLLLEKDEIGGLLLNANLVENYPGFPKGIDGGALVRLFREQLSLLEVVVEKRNAKKIAIKDDIFRLITDEDEIISRAVIVATGTEPIPIGIEGESDRVGSKLFYEIKDIPGHNKESTFVVIGGGDAAFDYALNLAREAKRVDIIFRSAHPRCLFLLEKRVKKEGKIHIHPKTVPLALKEEENLIKITCLSDGKEAFFRSDHLLIACGRKPNMNVLPKGVSETLSIGKDGSTNIPGLFMAGDVRRGIFRQTGIAVGDGILCAMSAVNFLRGDERK